MGGISPRSSKWLFRGFVLLQRCQGPPRIFVRKLGRHDFCGEVSDGSFSSLRYRFRQNTPERRQAFRHDERTTLQKEKKRRSLNRLKETATRNPARTAERWGFPINASEDSECEQFQEVDSWWLQAKSLKPGSSRKIAPGMERLAIAPKKHDKGLGMSCWMKLDQVTGASVL